MSDTLVYDSCEDPQTSFGEPKVEDCLQLVVSEPEPPEFYDALQLAAEPGQPEEFNVALQLVAEPEQPEEYNVALQMIEEMDDMTSARTVSKKAEKRAAKEEQRAAAEPEGKGKAKGKAKAKAKGKANAKGKAKAKGKGKGTGRSNALVPSPAEPAATSQKTMKRCLAASKVEDEPSRKTFRVRLQNGTSKGFPYSGPESRAKALQAAETYMYANSTAWNHYVLM